MIAPDDARLFERPHASQARRRGETRTLSQFDIGDPPLGLQLGKDDPVDQVDGET